MEHPASPGDRPPILEESEDEEAVKGPIVDSDGETEWLQSPTKNPKRRQRRGGNVRRRKRRAVESSSIPTVDASSTVGVPERQETGSDTVDLPHFPSAIDDHGSLEDMIVEEAGDGDRGDLIAEDADFEAFIRMVESGCIGFKRIGRFLFVVQGWNQRKREAEDRWYHMECRDVGDTTKIECMCPEAKAQRGLCMHQEYFLEFRDTHFDSGIESEIWRRDADVRLFWQEQLELDSEKLLMRFSVKGANEDLTGHAVVTYEGLESGWGQWQCTKDRRDCVHIQRAKRFLGKVIGTELGDEVEEEDGDAESLESEVVEERAVSFLPVLPPVWATLPTDTPIYTRTAGQAMPVTLHLTVENSSSSCQHRSRFIPGNPTVTRKCQLYTLTECLSLDIEVQACSQCPKRHHCYVGPDPREAEIFNYNNCALFTHELLNEYTSRLSNSETPFVAFVSSVSRVYSGRGSRFVGEDLFRSAWFAFVSLQLLDNDMSCPVCGDTPENVIWDGVTLAFSKKHLLDSLKPPTMPDDSSLQRPRKYAKNPQWIPLSKKDRPFRNMLITWLQMGTRRRGLVEASEFRAEEEDAGTGTSEAVLSRSKASVDSDRDLGFATIVKKLDEFVPAMGRLFRYVFGKGNLAADESAMQMVNAASLQRLEEFVIQPSVQESTRLIDIPALLLVIEGELRCHRSLPPELWEVCQWMVRRGKEVLANLKKGDLNPVPERATRSKDDSWKKVK
ncbi:hypothetical protein VNI00_018856 [Paramarasmius palmivorus]|uniref:HMG domain-containing protein n=1 Tax=Paramarasmius palmivorus TaxID=297713 RepID=A0AAW0AX38_9AGAR